MKKSIFYQSRNRNVIKLKVRTLITCFVVMAVIVMFFPHIFRKTYVVTVTNKRVVENKNNDRYLIYTQLEDGTLNVFENTNSLQEFKFNSEDIYWQLKTNRKYEIKVYGFNLPLISQYKNIVKVKGVEE